MNKTIGYLTVCFKNYDLILLQIENFKKLFNKKFNLIIVDNTPNSFKNYEVIRKIKSENENIKIINREYENTEFDGISHGHAIDIGVSNCLSDIICIFDSDFIFMYKNLESYILDLFNLGYVAVGCEFNDGTTDSTKYIDAYPERFENAPVCYAAFYDKKILNSFSFIITNEEVNKNRTDGYIETGWRIRKYIVDNKLKGITWKAERNTRPCYFKNEHGELIGIHYVAGSHYNFNNNTLNYLKNIIHN